MDGLTTRIDSVREHIASAARRVGRDASTIRLVAVTKTQPPELIAQAWAAGLTDFGENRVQEAEAKITALIDKRPQITWHLIGHLQSNKAKKAAGLFDVVHSIDSLHLSETLARHRTSGDAVHHERLPVLLQVNVSGEATKEGFALMGWETNFGVLAAFLEQVERILSLRQLEVRGLMTIAPWAPDPEAARPVFASTRRLRDRLAQRFPSASWDALSMGMTDDFAVAIEEGATIVRIGRAIFGER